MRDDRSGAQEFRFFCPALEKRNGGASGAEHRFRRRPLRYVRATMHAFGQDSRQAGVQQEK
jgi:hypothetical protein